MLIPALGTVIAAAAALQVLALLVSTLRRSQAQQQHDGLALELLRERVELARGSRAAKEKEAISWDGYRKFEVRRKQPEGGGICSFYLEPHDKKALASFHPGQYLTFRLQVPGEAKPVIRCYSLSDGPCQDYFRVSIKKVGPPRDKPDVPPGCGSSHFHDNVIEGDIIDVKAPSGHFFVDIEDDRPVVLIGGGVGLTPVLSMLNAIAAEGFRREVWFFYGARDGTEGIMKEHLKQLDLEHDKLHLHICYSRPRDEDVVGTDYHHAGRVSVELFKELLPSNNYSYYICGPGAFMESITKGLDEWGVPEANVHYEAFGPATIKKAPPPPPPVEGAATVVTFAKSGKVLPWDATATSLLDFAEANGIALDSACRAGNCGTCLTAVKAGEVNYLHEPGDTPEPGSCLTCIAVPKTDLELDA